MTEITSSVFRLCKLPGDHAHGTTISAKWDPSCSHRLITLFTTGILRVWDVILDEFVDYALHMPGATAFATVAARGPTPAKRSAIGISMFDFLPGDAAAGTSGPSIVFCTRRSRTVYVAQLPAPDAISAAAHPTVVDFLAGARVFEYATKLSSDACSIAAWAVAYPSSCGVFIIAVGCANGSVETWAGSTGLNPENVTGSRTLRDASPAIVRTRSALPPQHQLAPHGPIQQRPVLSHSAAVRPHAGRVSHLCPIPAFEAWAGNSASLFCSSSSTDGSVHLWRVAVLATPSAIAPTVIAGDISGVVVEPLFPLPTDGSLVTALVAVAWPFRYTSDNTGQVLNLPVRRLPGGPFQGSAEPPRGLRALLATGTVDGAVTLFECTFAHDLAVGAMTPPALPVARVVCSVAPQPAEPITSLALSPPLSAVSDEAFSLAVANAAGILRVYRIQVNIVVKKCSSSCNRCRTAMLILCSPSLHHFHRTFPQNPMF
jgi:hypothetical protein